MKIFVYSYREFDEAEFFQKFSKEYGVELGICKDAPTLENAHLAEGYEYLSYHNKDRCTTGGKIS